MLRHIKKWFQGKVSTTRSSEAGLRRSGAHRSPAATPKTGQNAPERQPEQVDIDVQLDGSVEENGPAKNVLIRNKYVREETGTYETLKILDDSIVDSGEETGIDPYNTGDFDRSKNWDKRFRDR